MEKYTKSFLIVIAAIALIVLAILTIPRFYNPEVVPYDDQYIYNGFPFTLKDGVWATSLTYADNLYLIQLRNGPLDLEDIPVTGSIAGFGNSYSKFYVTFDPTNHDAFVTMSNAEISPGLVAHFGKDLEAACTVESECESLGVDYVTCDSTDEGVIYLDRSAEAGIEIRENCAIISGTGEEMVMAADRFMYGLYGVMR